jgi:RNA polymerase sigma-70 factor (ECF subfamily)
MKKIEREFVEQTLPLKRSLFAQAFHLTRNRTDAEDLVQETYVRCLRNFEQFEQGTNLKAWMGRILFNQFINDYRRKKRRIESVYVEDVEEMAEASSVTGANDKYAEMAPADLVTNEPFMQQFDEKLKEGLQDLDSRYRDVLLLNTVGDLTYREIARKLSLPMGTVMSRLHRAKSFLRKRLAGRHLQPA